MQKDRGTSLKEGYLFTAFSSKAEKYARYRWGYSPQALSALLQIAGITPGSLIADIGAGTGILTRPLSESQAKIFAIEPNIEMSKIALRELRGCTACQVVRACAEAIPLPAGSVDLITVGTALHWFDPEPARAEFARIARPGGWLAVLDNQMDMPGSGPAFAALLTPENGALPELSGRPARREPFSFFSPQGHQRLVFPFTFWEDWESFLGAQLSHSRAPDEDHPLYPRFEKAARELFDQLSTGGWLEVHGKTELLIGQVNN